MEKVQMNHRVEIGASQCDQGGGKKQRLPQLELNVQGDFARTDPEERVLCGVDNAGSLGLGTKERRDPEA